MKKLVKRFIKEEEGLETIEWTLMAALIVLGFVILYGPIRDAIDAVFTALATQMNDAAAGPPA